MGGGLFQVMASEISRQGYRLPFQIPNYTPGGIPFAYPPLAFYGIAVLQGIGFAPLTIARLGSVLATLLYLPAGYLFVYEFRGSRAEALVATSLIALFPPIFRLHISAGGIVRATAFLFVFLSLIVGIRLFRTGGWQWLTAAIIFF